MGIIYLYNIYNMSESPTRVLESDNKVLVNSNKSFRTYLNAAIRLFEGTDEKQAVDKITLSGLGFAIYNTSLAAEQLDRLKFATPVSYQSDFISTEKSKGRNLPRLAVTLHKDFRNFPEALKKHKEAFEEYKNKNK